MGKSGKPTQIIDLLHLVRSLRDRVPRLLPVRGRGPSRLRERRGAAAVEFAIVAPVFLIFVFGMIDFGRMIMVQQLLTDAVREGARAAVLDGSSTSGVTQTVTSLLDATSVDSAAVTVRVEPADVSRAATGTLVTVRASVAFRDVCWLPTPQGVGNRTLAASCTMRHE